MNHLKLLKCSWSWSWSWSGSGPVSGWLGRRGDPGVESVHLSSGFRGREEQRCLLRNSFLGFGGLNMETKGSFPIQAPKHVSVPGRHLTSRRSPLPPQPLSSEHSPAGGFLDGGCEGHEKQTQGWRRARAHLPTRSGSERRDWEGDSR